MRVKGGTHPKNQGLPIIHLCVAKGTPFATDTPVFSVWRHHEKLREHRWLLAPPRRRFQQQKPAYYDRRAHVRHVFSRTFSARQTWHPLPVCPVTVRLCSVITPWGQCPIGLSESSGASVSGRPPHNKQSSAAFVPLPRPRSTVAGRPRGGEALAPPCPRDRWAIVRATAAPWRILRPGAPRLRPPPCHPSDSGRKT